MANGPIGAGAGVGGIENDPLSPEGASRSIAESGLKELQNIQKEHIREATDQGVPQKNILIKLLGDFGQGFRQAIGTEEPTPAQSEGEFSLNKLIQSGSKFADDGTPLRPGQINIPGLGVNQIDITSTGKKDLIPVDLQKERDEAAQRGIDLEISGQKVINEEGTSRFQQSQLANAVEQARQIENLKSLTTEESKAVAGSQAVGEGIDNLFKLLDDPKNVGLLDGAVNQFRIDSGKAFLVSGVLEEIQSELNGLKASIPFTKGGKQLTPFEARLLFRLLNTFGKEKATVRRDLERFRVESDRIARGVLTEEQAKKILGETKGFVGEDLVVDSAVKKSGEFIGSNQASSALADEEAALEKEKADILKRQQGGQ